MKINKSSWHYRLVDHWCATIPTSLCPYFWKVVWVVTLITILCGSLIFAIISVGIGLLNSFGITSGPMMLMSPVAVY